MTKLKIELFELTPLQAQIAFEDLNHLRTLYNPTGFSEYLGRTPIEQKGLESTLSILIRSLRQDPADKD